MQNMMVSVVDFQEVPGWPVDEEIVGVGLVNYDGLGSRAVHIESKERHQEHDRESQPNRISCQQDQCNPMNAPLLTAIVWSALIRWQRSGCYCTDTAAEALFTFVPFTGPVRALIAVVPGATPVITP